MICPTCQRMLRGHEGKFGGHDLRFKHHPTSGELERSAKEGCCFCYVIWHTYSKLDKSIIQGAKYITAHLFDVKDEHSLYRLEFKLDRHPLATFLLEQNDASEFSSYNPADSTNSKEVLELARNWIKQCTGEQHSRCSGPNKHFRHPSPLSRSQHLLCGHRQQASKLQHEKPWPPQPQRQAYYPSRLIDLRSHQQYDPISGQIFDETRVRLIDTKDHQLQGDQEGHYVTLSHCWGKKQLIRLLNGNLVDFRESISVIDLPQTFQDAIHFSRRLSPDIRYLWIDSLCILQDDKADWDRESVQMYEVYRNSHCNISATAATDSHQGLYFKRDRHRLYEDEVNLNIEGLREGPDINANLFCEVRAENEHRKIPAIGSQSRIRRCIVRDIHFWSRNVEDAPVNERAWVLQERLLAPRVMHFCQDQVAWECRELEAAESFPHGIWGLEFNSDKRLRQKLRLKAHDPEDGLDKLGAGISDAHEFWKQIVERYSTTQLTKHKDRLIAFVGIAQTFKSRIHGEYVAGIWRQHLASQLLWHVPPMWEKGFLTYRSIRPIYSPGDMYAPSFSWAAVHAPGGIKCGETHREGEHRIDVLNLFGIPERSSQRFGLVDEGCYLEISCRMQKIRIGLRWNNKNAHYVWNLEEDGGKETIRCDLDCPNDDFVDISGPDRGMYCVPMHMSSSEGLRCLLLREKKEGGDHHYCRVGYSLVPRDQVQHEATLDLLWPKSEVLARRTVIRIK